MVLNIDAKFEGKMTVDFNNDMGHDIYQLNNKAPHFSSSSSFFLLLVFLKIISQFCISQLSVRRKVFDK